MKPEIITENKFADVPLRVKTWLYIVFVFTVSISHPIAMKFFIAWIGYQVFYEVLRMFDIKINLMLTSLIIGISELFLLLFLDLNTYFISPFQLVLGAIVIILAKKVTRKQLLGIVLGFLLSLTIFPHLLLVRESFLGVKALVFLVVVTELNDVFQYFMGKLFGKFKVMPKISPNKTWEGLIGGVFVTILLSNVLGYFLLPSSIISNTVLSFILGVFGFFGDVFMSFIKRKTNVKDTGNLLPGHGGLLDRMDSLIFNAPIFFWMLPLLLNY
ncbi:CDP-archaeol synthase [Cellulophaga baltica]|uniref:phosphatidate cytidylyltransferase n=1 Tax=Cellulophaga TaxID=104264 RepID=UPI001C0700EA|nr:MULTISPECIES: CDP-archaeol synthase [Cellulophaga]MBU2996811.1 CDP-archaeol synthase [Cellulophaga baltica]MDO6768207.1 CDP-archaeol synthase [Cellulophaga sp. 1_MG-2023]